MNRDRLRYRFSVVLSFAFWVLVTLYTVAVFAALVIVFTALAGDHP